MANTAKTSIIIPCRNESGNLIPLIQAIIRILKFGDEIIIIEGGSTDLTYIEALELQSRFPSQIKTYQQAGNGKFDAVVTGISIAEHNSIMIWDADSTVNFKQNQEIYQHETGSHSLITGDRLRGRRDKDAMRFANWVGNWFFAILWSLILRKKPIDMLCGTKKFPKSLINDAPNWLLASDPYGDFSIFAMAKKRNLNILSIPVYYHARSFGKTNIHRWRGGFELLWLTLIILAKIEIYRHD